MRYIIITSAAFLIAFIPSASADTLDCEHVRSRDGSFSKFLCTMQKDDDPANCSVVDAKEGKILCDREPEVAEKKPPPLKCKWRLTNNGKRAVCW